MVAGAAAYSRPGMSSKVLPGDWLCPTCGVNNFASRTRCLQCGTGNPSPPALSPHQHLHPEGPTPRTRPTDRPGDWNCPNSACRYHNYASRAECYRCGSKRANSMDPAASSLYYAPAPATMKPGDWICSNEACRYHNFAKRDTCAMCGTSATVAAASTATTATAAGQQPAASTQAVASSANSYYQYPDQYATSLYAQGHDYVGYNQYPQSGVDYSASSTTYSTASTFNGTPSYPGAYDSMGYQQ
ncbi:hypothetical protein HK102_000036 [Quaeritorhiza haematococci]|nr:hypothetical protein HK102_000036 [Quaeritorhiza haematococci]